MNPPLLRSLLTHGRLMLIICARSAPDQHHFASRSNHSLTTTIGPSLHKDPKKDPPCSANVHCHGSDVCSAVVLAHSFLEKAVRRAQALCRSNKAKGFWQGPHAMPFELSSIRIRSMIQDMTDTIYIGASAKSI